MIDSIVLHKFPVGLSVQEASATKNGSTHTKAATELPTTTICHKYNEVVVCKNCIVAAFTAATTIIDKNPFSTTASIQIGTGKTYV